MKKCDKKNIEQLTKEENYSEIVKFLKKRIKKYPKDQELLYNFTLYFSLLTYLGKIKNIDKQRKKIKELYKNVILLNPRSDISYLARARIEEEYTGNIKKALENYKKVYKLNPSADNTLHLGNAHLAINNPKEAKKYFLIYYKKTKKNNIAYHIAMACLKLNKLREAKKWAIKYKKLLDKDKKYKNKNWYRHNYKEIEKIL